MYGFSSGAAAQIEANKLQERYPENRYVVQPHSWNVNGTPLSWGVARYIPYCRAMETRFDGFVWF
jgi:hypothetical protein